MRAQRGFTLVEIAVVIAIIGFLAFMITPLIGGQLAGARVRETRAKLEPVKAAIIAYVAANNHLPCPAIENLPSTHPQYGKEAPDPGTCTGTTALTGGASRGVIPWLTLGLTGEAANDAFGRYFTYFVTTSQTAGTANTVPGMTGIVAVHNATPVNAANQVNAGNLAVFVVISHGNNGNGAFNPGLGNRTPLPTGADELENTDTANVALVDKSFSDNAANPFDDIVLWVTPRDVLAALASSGVKTPQGAMNEKLGSIRAALLAYLTADNVDPDGGGPRTVARRLPCADVDSNGSADCSNVVGTVPWLALGVPVTTATDPWGRLIRYTVAAPTGNPALLLKNAAGSNVGIQASTVSDRTVTLTSDGPDGVAGNADDVSLTISAPELSSALLAAGVSVDP